MSSNLEKAKQIHQLLEMLKKECMDSVLEGNHPDEDAYLIIEEKFKKILEAERAL